MKGVIFIFCLVVFNGLGQTINRQLYERYFKSLYNYEPAMIRENNIRSLEVLSSEKRGDEVSYQGKTERVNFRKDGRPIHQAKWQIDRTDSVVTDYKYDSLGNLVEFRQWIPKRYLYEELIELEHRFFLYEAGYLIKVFSYSMKNGDNYSTLNYCDSLSYSSDKQKVSILHGIANGTKVVFQKVPEFIYPLKTRNQTDLIAMETERPDKPMDKEGCWSLPFNHINPELKKIQALMKTKSLTQFMTHGFESSDTPKLTFERIVFDSLNAAFFIDMPEERLFVKSIHVYSEPTSLEDRVTEIRSTDRYNFQMQLLLSESILNSSRGNWEATRDSSQTFYTYFDFGLLQRKLEYHYCNYRIGETSPMNESTETNQAPKNEPAFILEEKVLIKQWD